MSSGFDIANASVSNLAKRKYENKSRNMYNGMLPILGLIKKTYNNLGERVERPVPMGFQGGASFGSLGAANAAPYEKAYFTTKSVYCVAEIHRRTIKQFKNEGAFVDGIQETMKKTVEKFNWVMEYTTTGPGDGSLGVIDSVTDSGGGVYVLIITTASWIKGLWELREHINIGDGDTSRFEITAITRTSRSITVTRRNGSQVPTAGMTVYLEGGYGNAPQGLEGVTSTTAGTTLYGITAQDRWLSTQKDNSSYGISPDLLNELCLDIWDNVGVAPTNLIVPTLQLRKLLAQTEDLKRYDMSRVELAPRAKNLVGHLSFSAIQFMTVSGAISVLASRMVHDSKVYGTNFDEGEIAHSDQGWFDDEGFIFLRKAGADAYEARYGGYLEVYLPPTLNGRALFSTT